MTYYKITADFQIVRYAMNFKDAEKIYNEMIRDRMSHVELSLVKDYKHCETFSLKTYYC